VRSRRATSRRTSRSRRWCRTAHPEFEFLKSPNHPDRTHERIKAKRLRGVFSMGFLMPAPAGAAEGQDLAKDLGVYKYEEPEERTFEASRPPAGSASS
jgi:hypothetical protein